MPRGRPPGERPSKVCPVCGRPFAWRKKWERDWENVRYCSERCRRAARPGSTTALAKKSSAFWSSESESKRLCRTQNGGGRSALALHL